MSVRFLPFTTPIPPVHVQETLLISPVLASGQTLSDKVGELALPNAHIAARAKQAGGLSLSSVYPEVILRTKPTDQYLTLLHVCIQAGINSKTSIEALRRAIINLSLVLGGLGIRRVICPALVGTPACGLRPQDFYILALEYLTKVQSCEIDIYGLQDIPVDVRRATNG